MLPHSPLYLVRCRCFRLYENYRKFIKEGAIKLINEFQLFAWSKDSTYDVIWHIPFELFKTSISLASNLEEVEYAVIDCLLHLQKQSNPLSLKPGSLVKKNGDCMDFSLYHEKVVLPAIAAYNRDHK